MGGLTGKNVMAMKDDIPIRSPACMRMAHAGKYPDDNIVSQRDEIISCDQSWKRARVYIERQWNLALRLIVHTG